jgi:rubrerythrin
MTKLLIVLGLIAFVLLNLRRARKEAERARALRRSRATAGERPLGPPQQLVCGECGTEFEPDKSGWICPKCGK